LLLLNQILKLLISSFISTAEDNITKEFSDFCDYFEKEFCKGTTCDKYDHDIKLLSYP